MVSQCVSMRDWLAATAPRSNPMVQSTEPCSIGFLPSTPSSASTHVPSSPLPFLPVAHVLMPYSSDDWPPIRKYRLAL